MTEIQKACHFLTFSTVFHRIFTTFTSSGSGPLTPGSGWVCVVLPNRRVVSPYRVVRLVENSVRPSVFSPSSCCPLLAFFFFLLLSFSLLVPDLFSRSFCLLIFFQVAAGFFLFSFSFFFLCLCRWLTSQSPLCHFFCLLIFFEWLLMLCVFFLCLCWWLTSLSDFFFPFDWFIAFLRFCSDFWPFSLWAWLLHDENRKVAKFSHRHMRQEEITRKL